jgi:hypothetical protein
MGVAPLSLNLKNAIKYTSVGYELHLCLRGLIWSGVGEESGDRVKDCHSSNLMVGRLVGGILLPCAFREYIRTSKVPS